jgi:hypothetical protein
LRFPQSRGDLHRERGRDDAADEATDRGHDVRGRGARFAVTCGQTDCCIIELEVTMETVQFKSRIKNGFIEIPKKYQGKFKDDVRVILVAENTKMKAINYLDELMAHPLKVKGFHPLTREESHARN